MKRILFLSLFFTFSVANFFAKEIPIEKDLYEYNNIIGVFDYGSYQPFSIVPLSQNYIEEGEYLGVAIDNTSSENHTIYIDDNIIFAPEATNLKLYNINGLLIEDIQANTYNISHLKSGLYIIIAQYQNRISTVKIIK